MTPSQVYAYVEGYIERKKYEKHLEDANIYNLASLIKVAVWGKRMPTFRQVFPEKRKHMTDSQMYGMVKALNAAFGGTTE